ncbi:hypothetical protein BURK2_04153 [Burkholderiales bacterium]|nr:MAG: glycosyltransferase [Burkholderiales bacterium]CAG1010976.1 hypothetical protein BURK2_04153 [Burkholderiales bacterium]
MRILFVEDYPPVARYGAGLPRARAVLEALLAQGHTVSLYPVFGLRGMSRGQATEALPAGVHLLEPAEPPGLLQHLAQEAANYDLLWICRKHHMAPAVALRDRGLDLPPIVYDTEALEFHRDLRARRLRGEVVTPEIVAQLSAFETRLAGYARAVVTVSVEERRFYAENCQTPAFVISATAALRDGIAGPGERAGLLFVGALNADSEPNADALAYFFGEVWPRLRRLRPMTATIAGWGTDRSPLVQSLAGPEVKVLGPVADLDPLYARARLFIAPTRFAAGIPLKVIEAAAHGLPAVVSPLLAAQLGWTPEVELLAGSNPASFAENCDYLAGDDALWTRLAEAARARVASQFSREALGRAVCEVLAAAG